MALHVKILKNRYVDSVSLMAMSSKASEIEGIKEVIIAMATEMNKEVMDNVGLINDEIKDAVASDLVMSVKMDDNVDADKIFNELEQIVFAKKKIEESDQSNITYNTIENAYAANEDANLALISVNGHFATREAYMALDKGLNVMMFSDNVDIEDELKLKEIAHEKGLLMMGPDCGTAIINNVGLGFSNKVRKGNIGVIGASGTGSQEVSVRIHEFGGGISQLIGTGGRDLSEEIGGITMLDAIDLLNDDVNTEVILLVSKPPSKAVEEKIITKAKSLTKPFVIWFLGDTRSGQVDNVHFESMSKNAALKAVELAKVDLTNVNKKALNLPLIKEVQSKLNKDQKYIRGLFAGGTLCNESFIIAKEYFDNVYSNVASDPKYQLKDLHKSKEHTFIDFGSDEYTDGKPHPMIDPSNRIERFMQEAKDPEVGVIVMDFVLGYGAHPDPVGMMSPYIKQAISDAHDEGRYLAILGYVLGSDLDEQNVTEQFEKLIDAGAIDASSSQNTGLLARGFVSKD